MMEGQGEQQRRGMADASASTSDVAQGGMGAGLGTDRGRHLLDNVDGTIAALQGGLTSVPLESAAGLVARLHADLSALGAPEVRPVTQTLGQLQQALVTQQLDGAGPLLARLAAQVDDVAAQAPDAVRERLQTLSALLTSASEQLR
jgi:hypothetical protein